MAEEYDLVILGSGTGGYVAAIRAAQLGKKVAVVEAERLGGTCLHKGCIPSKSLLKSAQVFRDMSSAKAFGVLSENVHIDFLAVQNRKETIVDQLFKGVQHLLKKHNIDIYEGYGRMLGPSIFSPSAGSISIEKADGSENIILIPKNLILATGSRPRKLAGLPDKHELVMTSEEALLLETLPESVVIVGGGVIGTEWASMLIDFGVEVTMLESQSRILMTEDKDLSAEMAKQLQARGVHIVTDANVIPESFEERDEGILISANQNGESVEFKASRLLVSIGREANIDDIGLQNTDIEIENNKLKVNAYAQTNEEHIYAIGDIIQGPELAHAASHEGITAVEHMYYKHPAALNAERVPRCIYSSPEAAAIGLTEQEAVEKGYEVTVGKVPFQAIGKALINGNSEGFCKIITNKTNDDLLGVHMIGANATELISEAAVGMFLDAAGVEIAETIHPHPTSAEVMKEAAFALHSRAIHF